ncbi:MAG: hypothetical protein ACQETL_15045 [Bacteroidota bacterium]
MRYLLTIFLSVFLFSANAQEFQLLSQKDSAAVQFAHINAINESATYSDDMGFFSIETDSVIITHINYKDTLISLNNLSANKIYLKPNPILLKEVQVQTNKKVVDSEFSIYPVDKYKTDFLALNMSSFEFAMVFDLKNYDQAQLSKVKIPVKLGKDHPLIKLNVYELADNGRPSNLISSRVIKEYFTRRNQIIEVDFIQDRIIITRDESIAISIELVGYQMDDEISFKQYDKSKNALRIAMRLGNNEGFMRDKNQFMNWNMLNYKEDSSFEPAFVIGFTELK